MGFLSNAVQQLIDAGLVKKIDAAPPGPTTIVGDNVAYPNAPVQQTKDLSELFDDISTQPIKPVDSTDPLSKAYQPPQTIDYANTPGLKPSGLTAADVAPVTFNRAPVNVAPLSIQSLLGYGGTNLSAADFARDYMQRYYEERGKQPDNPYGFARNYLQSFSQGGEVNELAAYIKKHYG